MGGGGLRWKVGGKGNDKSVDSTRLKNLGRIESGGGFLLLFLYRGFYGIKIPTSSLSSLACNFCVTIISTRHKYILLLVLKHVDYLLTKMRIFVKYVSHSFLKYQSYICIYSPILVNYYNILQKSPHF